MILLGGNDYVVLETFERQDGTRTGLLFDRGDPELPFSVAYGFDKENMTWDGISRHDAIEDALTECKQLGDSQWFIRGLTPRDIIDAWGEEYAITQEDAREIARTVNEQTEEYMSAENETVHEYVEDICPRMEDRVTHEREANSAHEQTLVGGTMYLDVNGYDYVSARDSEQGASRSSGGSFETTDRFVTLRYSMVLVEEEMAREGIPLTQPNIAFMSDKIAKALRADAQENASYIAADTVAYWKSSCPDQAARAVPSQVAEHASAVARASTESQSRDSVLGARRSR